MFAPFWYLDELVRLRREIYSKRESDVSESTARSLAIGSAALSLMRPELPRADHPAVLAGAVLHTRWAVLDERALWMAGEPGERTLAEYLLATTVVDDPTGAIAQAVAGRPTVFCTAHLGSYRLLNVLLATAGVDFTLVVNSAAFAQQAARFATGWQACAGESGRGKFSVLDAEMGNVGLRALRQLRRGGSLVFYIDGNTGVGGTARRDEKLIPVDLLGQPLLARKGIAYLAHAADVPLVPVFCERTGWLDRTITFHEPLSASGNQEEYIRSATQSVYDRLGAYLRRVPEQWECWLHVHKHFDRAALQARATPPADVGAAANLLALAPDRYIPTRVGGREYILDRATLGAIPLETVFATR